MIPFLFGNQTPKESPIIPTKQVTNGSERCIALYLNHRKTKHGGRRLGNRPLQRKNKCSMYAKNILQLHLYLEEPFVNLFANPVDLCLCLNFCNKLSSCTLPPCIYRPLQLRSFLGASHIHGHSLCKYKQVQHEGK